MSVVIPSRGDASVQVSSANYNRIKINLEIEHGECRFEVNGQGRYVFHIEGTVNQLTTAVCNNLAYLPQLLAKGGTVMAVCYGLYKLGYSAGNFSPGSLAFEVEVQPAKLETIRRQLTKGRFAESLQDEVDAIILDHQTALAHIKKFKILSAKEVSMGETVKQSGSVFDAENLTVEYGAVMSSNINIGDVVGAQNPSQQPHPPQDMPSRVNLRGATVSHGAVGSTNVNIATKKSE